MAGRSATEVFAEAAAAEPGDRIGFRDELVASGTDAVEPLAGWLLDPRLGAFEKLLSHRRMQSIRELRWS